SFFGVDQSDPIDAVASAAGNSGSASVTVAAPAGDLVLDAVTANGDAKSLSAAAIQTPSYNVATGAGGANVRGAGSTRPAAGATVTTWSLGSAKPWSIIGVALKPAI